MCVLVGSVVGVVHQPVAAQGITAPDRDLDAPVVLDPTDFDPTTITDTEVSRMRFSLMSDLLGVQMVDRRAASLLADARSELVEARTELTTRTAELEVLENTLGAAAIEGYIADNEAENATFFGFSADASALFADETAAQLLQRRTDARDAVAAASSDLELAERSHRVATSRKRQAERSVEAHHARQEAFDALVETYERAAVAADQAAAALSDEVDLRSVAGGIIVNAEIEHDVDRLIADARVDGLVIGGGGYRTVEAQIALRLSHCGGSVPSDVAAPGPDATPDELAAYAAAVAEHQRRVIYEVPAGSCSPPTATPGNSEHQLGLAIDFTEDGVILDRNSAVYAWLDEHAEAYGLINLPSEAWHWSTTGS